jgi:hypothetical protein
VAQVAKNFTTRICADGCSAALQRTDDAFAVRLNRAFVAVVHEAHRELIDTEFITLGEALSMVRNRTEKTESFDDLVGANVASGLPTLP